MNENKPNDASTLWAWVTEENGNVNQVGGFVPRLAMHVSLTARSRELIELMRPLAREHGRATGQRVWLREYRIFKDHGEA